MVVTAGTAMFTTAATSMIATSATATAPSTVELECDHFSSRLVSPGCCGSGSKRQVLGGIDMCSGVFEDGQAYAARSLGRYCSSLYTVRMRIAVVGFSGVANTREVKPRLLHDVHDLSSLHVHDCRS